MAETQNESVYGKKIFFINPNYTFRSMVIPELRNKEYEVCIIENFRDAKNILRKNPGSILFINVDAHLSLFGWFIFIDDLKDDPVLKTIIVGVLSDRITDKEKQFFMERLSIPAGMHRNEGHTAKLTETFLDILEMHKAKGRRQYVRANCLSDHSSVLIWNENNKMHQVKLVDISVMGAAAVLPSANSNIVQEKMIVRGATLKIGTKQFIIDFIVYAIHQRGDKKLLITLFTPETVNGIKDSIQEYVYSQLHEHMLFSISGEKSDDRDYNQLGKSYHEASNSERKGGAAK